MIRMCRYRYVPFLCDQNVENIRTRYAHLRAHENSHIMSERKEGQFGMVGALFGVTLQLYANGAMKRPLMSRPWMHVIFAGVGLLGGLRLEQWQYDTKRRLDLMLEQTNRQPRLD